MRNKITRRAFCSMLLALPFSARAQQAAKIPRIGLIWAVERGPNIEAFGRGLREFGYVEGKNILIENRYVDGKLDRVPSLVAELLRLKVDVLVTGLLPAIRAAKQATKTVPIVMMSGEDPVATGLVDSLARPGGNVTGLTRLTRELSGKRLELLKEAVPKLSRVGILFQAGSTSAAIGLKEYEAQGRALKIPIQSLAVQGPPNTGIESAFQAAAKARVNAIITVRTGAFISYRKEIADLAIKYRLPSMHEGSDFVEAGGLVSYSSADADQFKRAAYFVDRILKGTKPAELPVEQPMKFELVINLKTANQIGLTIPQWTLMKADRVIKEASAKAGGR